MNRRQVALSLLIAVGSSTMPLLAHAARYDIDINVAPPPPRVIAAPPPRAGYVWAPGYWRWEGRRHVWIDGRWVGARRGWHWAPDRWVDRRGRYHLERGRWERD